MAKEICKNLFSMLFLISAAMLPIEQVSVGEIGYDLLQKEAQREEHNVHTALPHDEEQETEVELNDIEDAEVDERPSKHRRKKRNTHQNFS